MQNLKFKLGISLVKCLHGENKDHYHCNKHHCNLKSVLSTLKQYLSNTLIVPPTYNQLYILAFLFISSIAYHRHIFQYGLIWHFEIFNYKI